MQEVLFYSIAFLILLAFSILIFLASITCVRADKRENFKRRIKMKFKGTMLRFIMEFYVPVFISVFLNIRFLKL